MLLSLPGAPSGRRRLLVALTAAVVLIASQSVAGAAVTAAAGMTRTSMMRTSMPRTSTPQLSMTRAGTASGSMAPLGTVSPNCNTVAPESITGTVGSAEVEATFDNPVAHAGQDLAQLNEMIRLINCTPGGATIRMAIYSITANIVYHAIADAVSRGVLVQVVHNGEDKNSGDSSPTDLANLLGANHHWCDHGSAGLAYGGGCISNDPSSLMHAKYMLFSQTEDLSGVLKTLVNNGIAVHSAPVHDKLMIFYGSYADVATNRYTLFTGSHNLTQSALTVNDELLFKIQGVPQTLYQAFYNHFGDAYSTGTVCSATSCPAQGGTE
jgi:phosphatidylserine/phosphatidylglycerophosphate/cardiolipin synthase-like enzyme